MERKRKRIIEPEVSADTREQSVINSMAWALVAASGISLAIAAGIAHKHFHEAKIKAVESMNETKE